MTEKLKRERRCVWKAWGKYAEQTVRFNLDAKRYEISQGNRMISVDCNEVDSLIVSLLEVRAKAKDTRKNKHGK